MSTLTSAQLCVKRSSTRLHAPPGGRSTLSFGPGGFGAAYEPEDKADGADPALALGPGRPSSRGDAAHGGQGSATAAAATTDYYAVPPASSCGPPPSSWGPPASSWGHPSSSRGPPTATYGPPGSSCGPPDSSWGRTPPAAYGRPISSSSAGPWSGQPPLTASKRDQNWEKKRRQWLARKNASGREGGQGYEPPGPRGSWPAAADDGFADAAMPPASPLSKFMHQHADRLPTAVPSADPYYYQADSRGPAHYASYSSGGSSYAPPTSGPPPTASYPNYSAAGPSYGAGGSSYSYAAPPQSSSGRGPTPSTASTTRAGSRQPPGGHCNWSPFN